MTVILKPKPKVETDIHNQQETVAKANTADKMKEVLMITREDVKNKLIELKAPKLANALGGDIDDRMSQERTITIKMSLDKRAEVTLTGFWNGRLIGAAQNAIAKAYRQRRITATKM